jgi:hypothetical protein
MITRLVFKLFLILQYWQSYHIFSIYKIVEFVLNTIIVEIFQFMQKKNINQNLSSTNVA